MSVNDQSTLVGLFKEVYAQSIVDLWPDITKLQDRVKFDVARAIGNKYHQPVDLVLEHGMSFAAGGTNLSTSTPAAYFLPPGAGQMQDAQVTGAIIVGRSAVSYSSIFASSTDKKAFLESTKAVVKRLSKTAAGDLEIELLHGQQGLGVISANPANGASRTVVLTAASWAAGIWAGRVGATLDLYNAAGVKQNTGSTAGGDAITISSIDTTTRSLVLATPNASDQTLNLANDLIFWETASPTKEMAGLDAITSLSSTSPSLFNINPATYDLWNANQYNVAGAISFGKLSSASSLAANYGAFGDSCAVVSPKQFEVINTDLAALRMYDVSYKKNEGEAGVKSITFYNQTGTLEVLPHLYQKDGLAHIFMPDEAKRIGTTDLTFIQRQGSRDVLILEDPNSTSSEMRIFTEQALFVEQPRHTVRLYGIT